MDKFNSADDSTTEGLSAIMSTSAYCQEQKENEVIALDSGRVGYWKLKGDCRDNFSGKINEVRVYNRALSEAEIGQNCDTHR